MTGGVPEGEKPLVLVVDDDLLVLTITRRLLARSGFVVRTVDDGRIALCEALAQPPFALVADLQMPDLDGASLLGLVRALLPNVVRVLHTGEDPGPRLTEAQAAGVFTIVQKSGHSRALTDVLTSARGDAATPRRGSLPTAFLLAAQLSDALMPRLGKPRGAGTRLAESARLLSGLLGLSRTECDAVALAAQLHDVAMAAVSPELFRHAGPLDPVAWSEVRQHPARAVVWLQKCTNLSTKFTLESALRCVAEHHERVDGSGYPGGLVGEAISLGARVLSVLDAYYAMQRPRAHAPVRDAAKARAEIARCAGSQFDSDVTRIFLGHAELH